MGDSRHASGISGLPPSVLGRILSGRTVLYDRFVIVKNKKNEQEDAVLFRTEHQILLLNPKGKIITESHLLEIKKIESKSTDELVIFIDKKEAITLKTPHCDEIISHIRVGFARDFPFAREDMLIQLSVTPASRLESYSNWFPEFDFKSIPVGPCGGFSRTYRSLCVFHNQPARDDIIWDIDNIVFVKSVKDFNLTEIDDVENSKDVVPLMGALEGNKWFTSLTIRDIKLVTEAQIAVSQLLRHSASIDSVELTNFGGTEKFFLSLGESLSKNTALPLVALNLSDNNIKDEGITTIASAIQTFPGGLVNLNLSNCNLTKKGAVLLGTALKKNKEYLNSLHVLDLSNNNIGPEGVASLADFFAQPNNIKRLNLSATNPNLEALFAALGRGCTQTLTHLNLSLNKFAKKATVTQASFEQFFSAVISLKHINFAGSKMPTSYLEALLSRVISNSFINDVIINLSDNDLTALSASLFLNYLSKAKNIIELDISENELEDNGIVSLLQGVKNSSIQRLRLERMFKTRSKFRNNAIQELVNLLGSDRCKLTMLSLANCSLKSDIIEVIDAIGPNENLIKLDVSGNQFGDKGTYALSKSLQINQTLKTLLWDNNNPTISGYSAFIIALSRNRTLQQMPLPMTDIAASLKVSDARTRTVIKRMEEILAANQRPSRLDGSASVDKAQGQLLNVAQQDALDRLTVQVKRAQSALPEDVRKTSEFQQVKDEIAVVFADVESNRHLASMLTSTMEGLQAVQDTKLAESLTPIVQQLEDTLEAQFQKAANEAMEAVTQTFKSLKASTQFKTFLNVGAQRMDRTYLNKVIVQQLAAELAYSRSTSMASVVSITSNFTFERLQEKLDELLERVSTLNKIEVAVSPSAPAIEITAADKNEPDETTTELPISTSDKDRKKKNRQSRRLDPAELGIDEPTVVPVLIEAPVLDLSSASTLGETTVVLTHATKSRPTQANKRLPSRQARPSRGATTRLEKDDDDVPSASLHPPKAVVAPTLPTSEKPVAVAAVATATHPAAVTTPAVTVPAVTTPVLTPPVVAVPAVAVPAVAVPAVAVPAVAVPAVAIPAVTTPAVTIPTVVAPTVAPASVVTAAAAAPIATAPVVTVPAVVAPLPVTAPAPATLAPTVSAVMPPLEDEEKLDKKTKSGFFSKLLGKKDDKPSSKTPLPTKPGGAPPATAADPPQASGGMKISPSTEKLSSTATSLPAPAFNEKSDATSSSPSSLQEKVPEKEKEKESSEQPVIPSTTEQGETAVVDADVSLHLEPPKIAEKPKLKPKLPPGAIAIGVPMGAAMAQQQQAMAAIAQRRAAAAQKEEEQATSTSVTTTTTDEAAGLPSDNVEKPAVPVPPRHSKPLPPAGFKLPPVVPKPSRPLPSAPSDAAVVVPQEEPPKEPQPQPEAAPAPVPAKRRPLPQPPGGSSSTAERPDSVGSTASHEPSQTDSDTPKYSKPLPPKPKDSSEEEEAAAKEEEEEEQPETE